jgi:NAD(P)-dependent dehydrogenase (short-subunit alcohol dehydrogenase family)
MAAHPQHQKPLLAGKTAFITGASRGIGAAAAEAIAENGAKVMLAARSKDDMESLASQLKDGGHDARFIQVDVTDPRAVADAIQHTADVFGRLDIAVNNAGITQKRIDLHKLPPAEFDNIINVNLRALFLAMQTQIELMLQTGGGSIVNIASVTSVIGVANMGAYVSSKHAVLGLTRSAALDYARQGIRINAIAPGPIMTDQLRSGAAATAEGAERMRALIPMGRIGESHEVAGAIVFLASDAASFITGACLPVDGGYSVP